MVKSNSKVCFILGIEHRSGTNYLYHLLELHPDCLCLGPIWEDYLISHSNLLVSYVEKLYASWNPAWEVKRTVGPPSLLLRYIGNALVQFLKLQVVDASHLPASEREDMAGLKPKILLTKTPSVHCLENFFDLFPDAYLLIVVRDGRSVVESSVKSFNGNYEQLIRAWASSALKIIHFGEKFRHYEHKYLIVKYEDLYAKPREELEKILKLLNLDLNRYDFVAAESLPVIGSSDTRKAKQDKVHWTPVEKTTDFNPLMRWSQWGRIRHEQFNWLAGKELLKLGYTPHTVHTYRVLWISLNLFLDMKWKLCLALRYMRSKLQKLTNYLCLK